MKTRPFDFTVCHHEVIGSWRALIRPPPRHQPASGSVILQSIVASLQCMTWFFFFPGQRWQCSRWASTATSTKRRDSARRSSNRDGEEEEFKYRCNISPSIRSIWSFTAFTTIIMFPCHVFISGSSCQFNFRSRPRFCRFHATGPQLSAMS